MNEMIVSIRVQDATTNQPTPVRLRLTDAGGNYIAPLGRLNAFPTGRAEQVGGQVCVYGRECAYIDGQCEARLPAGPIHVEISKGPEFTPLCETVELRPGKMALRFSIQRHSNLPAAGWHAGDVHAHFLSPYAAALEGAAEGLQVVNLLAVQWLQQGKTALSNLLEFSGQQPVLERDGCLVAVNTCNQSVSLGQLLLLHCHRIVHPLALEEAGFEKYTLRDWCDQCHRKGGLVIWSAFPAMPLEANALVHLGAIDAVEWLAWHRCPDADWYRYLDLGCRLPLVGGSGKCRNDHVLGDVRTYAHVPVVQSVSYGQWIEAVRAGRTFVTRGPLLEFEVDGQQSGAVLSITDRKDPFRIKARSWGAATPTRLQVVYNGAVIGEVTGNAGQSVELRLEHAFDEMGWVAARCWACSTDDNEELLAHTSPVYLEGPLVPRNPQVLAEIFREWEDERVEQTLAKTPLRRQKVEAILAEARALLERNLQ